MMKGVTGPHEVEFPVDNSISKIIISLNGGVTSAVLSESGGNYTISLAFIQFYFYFFI